MKWIKFPCTVWFSKLLHECFVASLWILVFSIFPSPQLNLLPEHFTLPHILPSRSVLHGIKWTTVCSLDNLCMTPCFATFPLFKLLPFMTICYPTTQWVCNFESCWISEGVMFLNVISSTQTYLMPWNFSVVLCRNLLFMWINSEKIK